MRTARWETETRWYEVHIFIDLFGDCTVVRHWGGKGSRRQGRLIEIVGDAADAASRVETLDKERRQRQPPYQRVL